MTRDKAVRARVVGHVQGVAYRAWTRGTARSLGLRGWVRNETDGSVTALLIGPEDKVDEMTGLMWAGPGAADVRDVACRAAPVPEGPEGFDPFSVRR